MSRVGFNYLKVLLAQTNRDIEVVNLAEARKDDLMPDFVSIITSFCARLYSIRRRTRKTECLIKCLEEEDEISAKTSNQIKFNKKNYLAFDKLAFLSKNLYNCAVYLNRQAFFSHQPFLTMTELHHALKTSADYQALPAKVSPLVLKQVEKTFKYYQKAQEQFKKSPNKFTG